VDAQERGTPANEPVKFEVVLPAQKRDVGWWFSTIGPVVIAALALLVAFVSLLDQQKADDIAQAAQTLTARTDASEVFFSSTPNVKSQFIIDNRAGTPITSVLVQPTAHGVLDRLEPVAGCTEVTLTLGSATTPVIYFRDANGQSWEEMVNGVPEPFANPSALIFLLPAGDVSSLLSIEGPPQQSC
jgi:hypothetical protein